MTTPTREELEAGTVEVWACWLRSALLAYTAPTSAARKVRAFFPLAVDPESASPAGEIVAEIRKLVVEPNGAPANAAVDVVREWDPAFDGCRGGALALQIATRLGGRGLYRATLVLVSRASNLVVREQREIAFLAIRAASARFRRSEVEELSRRLWQLDMLSPDLAGELALIFQREDFGGLSHLPRTIAGILPGLMAEPHDGLYAHAIATSLLGAITKEKLVRSLKPDPMDSEGEADIRMMLQREAVPWSIESNNGDEPLEPSDANAKEFIARRDFLNDLGDQVDPVAGEVIYLRDRKRQNP